MDSIQGTHGEKQIFSISEAYVPPQLFYNGKVDYFDLQRLGGLLSHLKKTLKGKCSYVQCLHPGPDWISPMRLSRWGAVGNELWLNLRTRDLNFNEMQVMLKKTPSLLSGVCFMLIVYCLYP